MLEFLTIDLAGQRPISERTAAIKAALATLDAARPKHAPATPARNTNSRFLRDLIASFKPPPREPVPPLHSLERGLGGEVGRAPPALAPA
jgi:hypothetical protein